MAFFLPLISRVLSENHSAEIEEERRMFYVAVTRAKNRLFLLHCTERLGRKKEASRFINEMEL